MNSNAGFESRSAIKRRFAQFSRTVSVMDLREAHMTRKARCEKFARKNKTCGKRAVFAIGDGY